MAANCFHNYMLKKLFDSLFDTYNPKRKEDENSVKTYNQVIHKSIIDKCEPAVFPYGNVSELKILDGEKGSLVYRRIEPNGDITEPY